MSLITRYPSLVTIHHFLVHTGQHYDYEMSKVFFEDLDLPEPDIYLGVGSGTHAEQTGKVMMEFEKVLMGTLFTLFYAWLRKIRRRLGEEKECGEVKVSQ